MLTERERFRRKAVRLNHQERQKYPLLVEILPERTAESEAFRWRKNLAKAAEYGGRVFGTQLLESITESLYVSLAADNMPACWVQKISDYRWRVFPKCPSYGLSLWRTILTGQTRIVLSWKRIPAPETTFGFRVVADEVLPTDEWKPPFTTDMFDSLYPVNRFQEDDRAMDFGFDPTVEILDSLRTSQNAFVVKN